MRKDRLVYFAGREFQCLDSGFGKDEPVDVVIRPEDVIVKDKNDGMLSGTVTSVTFKGVHYEMIVDVKGFKWMIQSTKSEHPDDIIGIDIIPDAIHIMKKSEYSGLYGDYSSYSEEMDVISDPDIEIPEEQ
jgi:spermidine/putrescine transport system ATP-binding protein